MARKPYLDVSSEINTLLTGKCMPVVSYIGKFLRYKIFKMDPLVNFQGWPLIIMEHYIFCVVEISRL